MSITLLKLFAFLSLAYFFGFSAFEAAYYDVLESFAVHFDKLNTALEDV